MPDASGKSATVHCEVCGFENTTTSLYCQDCGVRLVAPPSAVEGEDTPAAALPTPAKPKTPPRILSEHRSNPVLTIFLILLRTLVVAALLALIIEIVRPPAGVPPTAAPLSEETVNYVRAQFQKAARNGGPIDSPWPSMNAYLATVLAPGKASGSVHSTFERALVAPSEIGISLFIARKVGTLTLYSRIDYRLVPRSSGIDLEAVHAALGRLPLPDWAMPTLSSMNGGLDQALASELTTLHQAVSISIAPDKAIVDFGPPNP